MSYFGSNLRGGSVRAKHVGILSLTALSLAAGLTWFRRQKQNSDTGGQLVFLGTQRFDFDT